MLPPPPRRRLSAAQRAGPGRASGPVPPPRDHVGCQGEPVREVPGQHLQQEQVSELLQAARVPSAQRQGPDAGPDKEGGAPATSQSIPTFYFPRGRPQGTVNIDAVIAKIERTFAQFPHERATMEDMGKVAKHTARPRRHCGLGSRPPQQSECHHKASHTNCLVSECR
ncbi:serine/threonine-protein phosphatase 2A regulatory subunit B'' subunit beta-like isoform X3 [Equus caballus]|uniref:serine/threonine-protein phosphatase 2A regulatory subunit B'' subunit beta-like isoform X3 n=1 Tax=Equus caballus TaxID=9796 RepID=UPI0038B3DFC7